MRFICSECSAVYPLDTRKPRCECGGLFDLERELAPFALEAVESSDWSMWRYGAFMGVDADLARSDVSLGEGMTPIVRYDEDVLLKMDYMMPTLSFKDRGAAALVAHCKAIGVDTVVQDSSGNAGHAVAAYCARAGISCEIYVPEGTSPKKIALIEAHGATCHVVPGSRDHCAEVCRARVEADGVYYANHVYNPVFYEGTKTYIYEAFEQLGRMPRHILVPVGNGTLFLGAMKALEHLEASGVIDDFPQVIAVQAEGCDPLLQAEAAGEEQVGGYEPGPTIAEGIAIGAPMRSREILSLARRHGVRFVHAPEGEILPARERLAARGVYVEHTTAANLAGYEEYCRIWGPAPDTLITMCGAGMKSDH